jgi:hypothetical protein
MIPFFLWFHLSCKLNPIVIPQTLALFYFFDLLNQDVRRFSTHFKTMDVRRRATPGDQGDSIAGNAGQYVI